MAERCDREPPADTVVGRLAGLGWAYREGCEVAIGWCQDYLWLAGVSAISLLISGRWGACGERISHTEYLEV